MKTRSKLIGYLLLAFFICIVGFSINYAYAENSNGSDGNSESFTGGKIVLDDFDRVTCAPFVLNPVDENSNNILVDVGEGAEELIFINNEKAGLVSKLLRIGVSDLTDFTFSFDFKFANETLTEGAISVVPFVRLQSSDGWQSKGWEPKTTLSTDGTAYYLMNRFYKRPYDSSFNVDALLEQDQHKITVVGQGDTIGVYIDDVLKQSNVKEDVADNVYPGGDVGILVYSENANVGAKVSVSNIRVVPKAEIPGNPNNYTLPDVLEMDFNDEQSKDLFVQNTNDGQCKLNAVISNGEMNLKLENASAWQYGGVRFGKVGTNFTFTANIAMDDRYERTEFGIFVRTTRDKDCMVEGISMFYDSKGGSGNVHLQGRNGSRQVVSLHGGADNGAYLNNGRCYQYIQFKIIGEGQKITLMIGEEEYSLSEFINTTEKDKTSPLFEDFPTEGEIGFFMHSSEGKDGSIWINYLKLEDIADYSRPVLLSGSSSEDGETDEDEGNTDTEGNKDNTGGDTTPVKPTENKSGCGCGSSLLNDGTLIFAIPAILASLLFIFIRRGKTVNEKSDLGVCKKRDK